MISVGYGDPPLRSYLGLPIPIQASELRSAVAQRPGYPLRLDALALLVFLFFGQEFFGQTVLPDDVSAVVVSVWRALVIAAILPDRVDDRRAIGMGFEHEGRSAFIERIGGPFRNVFWRDLIRRMGWAAVVLPESLAGNRAPGEEQIAFRSQDAQCHRFVGRKHADREKPVGMSSGCRQIFGLSAVFIDRGNLDAIVVQFARTVG